MKKGLFAVMAGLLGIGLCTGCQVEQEGNEMDGLSILEQQSDCKTDMSSTVVQQESEKIVAQPNKESLTICVDARYRTQAEELINAWETINEGVRASLVIIPEDISAAEIKISELQTEMMAGGGPDVFLVSCQSPNVVTKTPELFQNPEQAMEQGAFLSLDDYLDRAQYINLSDLNQTILTAGKTDDGQMVLPMYYDYYAYAFRTDDLKGLEKVPSTWDELAGCEDNVVMGAVSACLWVQFYDIFGQLADDEAGIPAFTEDELMQRVREAVKCSERMRGIFVVPEPIYADTAGLMSTALQADRDEEHVIFPLPNVEGGVTANITMFAAINHNTKQPENAFSLLDLLFSEEVASGKGFDYGEKILGNLIKLPEGISINDTVYQQTLMGCSGEDQKEILAMQERINVARFHTSMEEDLCQMYQKCVSAGNEHRQEQQDSVSQAYNAIWMKLSE